jgi:hypothetical protein
MASRTAFVQGSFGRACKRAGIVGVTPHTLRHTCGTWMAQQGVPLRLIGEYLGHSDERTTKLYAHHHPDYQGTAVRRLDRRRPPPIARNGGNRPLKSDSLAPSEGRGHRFESCRVRQSSQRLTTNFVRRSRKWFVRVIG